MTTLEKGELLALTAKIVSAYGAGNQVAPADWPNLITEVHHTLATVGTEQKTPELEPAVPIKKSVSRNYIVCLECGEKQKMLKRHVRVAHNLSPEEYRERWSLLSSYPMVSPAYADVRSKLAKKIGLGLRRGRKKARR